jgi:hypothetical protein
MLGERHPAGQPMRAIAALVLWLLANAGPALAETPLADQAFDLFSPVAPVRHAAIDRLASRGQADAAAALILALRFMPDQTRLDAALARLTGAPAGGADAWAIWTKWMLWQETHPEVAPFAGFDDVQARVFRSLDPNFGVFLKAGIAHEIRLEEITWGGVLKDGIPALTNPKLVAAKDATYLTKDELVFGIDISGDARAYPLRIMDWHEMFNDVIGGVPVSLAYCTLCGSGILYETAVEGRAQPFVFGSSGFLYRSNKLMYDTATHSLWNQFTGRPVVGPLTGSGIELKVRPVVITSWRDWQAAHPSTRVLDIETGHARDYRPGRPYGDYFASPDLMFPTMVDQSKLKQKDYVFVLRGAEGQFAWPLARFAGGQVITDKAGLIDLVLIGDQATRTVRAYKGDGRGFAKGSSLDRPVSGGAEWQAGEEALAGPGGERFPRLPGHIAYWFAWSGYFGKSGTLHTGAP